MSVETQSRIKPGALPCRIKEQIIEDQVTGLTLQFDALPDGTSRLTILGDFPLGNRNWIFNAEGEEAGGGSGLCCAPSTHWLLPVDRIE